MPEESFVAASDGVRIAVRRLGGDLPVTVAFVHATGFCQALWDPVIEELHELGATYPMLTWDQRGHGNTDPPPGEVDWWDLGRDSLTVLSDVPGPVVGVGHSSGAAALIKAEVLAPGRFVSIVAIEPIIFPPPYGSGEHHPLAQSARRRRPSFPTRPARANFVAKPVFAGWDPRALDAYVRDGLVEVDDEVRLACDPDIEAAFYAAAGTHQAWDHLGEVAALVWLVAGDESASHPLDFVEHMAAELPRSTIEIVPGASHFLPMEMPEKTARIVAQAASAARESTSRS